jgi:gamma-glutamylcyclotransferase (GGCT)/AIG2-like uncharacterized protein YtfP
MISSSRKRRDSLLFVYGTLRPFVGIAMATWLRSVARHIGRATVPGRLYDLGDYPGMRAARRSGERVVGDVYSVPSARVFRVLDRYEAGARGKPRFVRELCAVDLGRGGRRVAWTYRYRGSVLRVPRITSGDYQAHCKSIVC